MEFNQELLINFAPIILILGFTIVTLVTVFNKLKIRWPIKANCWFCNYNARIWKNEVDWWFCPFCSQYNGFSKDGDYKYPIPEQRKMPQTARFYTTRNASNMTAYENHLCIYCNSNEEFKLSELRKFEKVNSIRTDKEVQEFKRTIEEKYPLCLECKQVVNDVLHKQSLWLTRYKMMIFKQRPVKLILHNGYKIEKISRILLIIIDAAIMYNHALWPLSIVGVILQLRIFLIVPKCDKQQEIFLTMLWIWISILSTFNEFYLLKTNSITLWVSSNCVSKHHFIIALGSIIGIMNLKAKSFKISRKNLTFKKLDTSANSSELQSESHLSFSPSLSSSTSLSTTPSGGILKESAAPENLLHSPVNVTNLLINSEHSDTAIPIRSSKLLKNNRSYFNQFSVPKCTLQKISNCDTNRLDKAYNEEDNLALNDSLHNLSTLSLNQGYPEKLVKTSSVFETKTYSTSSSALFSKFNMLNKTSKKSILTPSKLKSITGSWVAGGYWQEGMDPPSLSRSSSQSSGLGSAGSNLGPSRETSVYNDFDQCSIVSGAMQCCCSSHKLSQICVNSNCRFTSSFNRPPSLSCNHLTDLPHNQISFNNSLPLMHLQVSNSSVHDQYVKFSENVMKHFQQAPVFTEHKTVITSPFWLPLLLCSSLIVNIIVLCTVLLH